MHALPLALAAAQTFTVIGLPDTQHHSESYPQIFLQQTQGIATAGADLDVRYVSHYGDVVQHGDQLAEWDNADLAMTVLDQFGVPYGVAAGRATAARARSTR
jgi:hypothetical protein